MTRNITEINFEESSTITVLYWRYKTLFVFRSFLAIK